MPIRVLKGQAAAPQPAAKPAVQMSAKEVRSAMNWKRYGVSAANSFVSAATASIGSGSAAQYFGVNATISLKIAGATAVLAGVISFCKWLSQHPLPGAEN